MANVEQKTSFSFPKLRDENQKYPKETNTFQIASFGLFAELSILETCVMDVSRKYYFRFLSGE